MICLIIFIYNDHPATITGNSYNPATLLNMIEKDTNATINTFIGKAWNSCSYKEKDKRLK